MDKVLNVLVSRDLDVLKIKIDNPVTGYTDTATVNITDNDIMNAAEELIHYPAEAIRCGSYSLTPNLNLILEIVLNDARKHVDRFVIKP